MTSLRSNAVPSLLTSSVPFTTPCNNTSSCSLMCRLFFCHAAGTSLFRAEAGERLAPDDLAPPLVVLLADMGVPGLELEGGAGPPQLPAVLCTDCTRVMLPPVCAVLGVPGVPMPGPRGLIMWLGKGCCCMLPMGLPYPKGGGVPLPRLVLTQPPGAAGRGVPCGAIMPCGGILACAAGMPAMAPCNGPALWGAAPGAIGRGP